MSYAIYILIFVFNITLLAKGNYILQNDSNIDPRNIVGAKSKMSKIIQNITNNYRSDIGNISLYIWTEIVEISEINGLLPDYGYYFKAKMSINAFENLMKLLGLEKGNEKEEIYIPMNKQELWSWPKGSNNIYIDKSNSHEFRRAATYSSGMCFYFEILQ